MAVRDFGNVPLNATAGKLTNPVDQTIHADTGALVPTGNKGKVFELTITMGGSVAAIFQIQRRNAANGANVAPSPFTVYTLAGQSVTVWMTSAIEAGERIRVTNDGAITGTTAASIMAEALT